jgi:hypothetical protein
MLSNVAFIALLAALCVSAAPPVRSPAPSPLPPFPTPVADVRLSAPQIIKAGEVFDGLNQRFGRGAVCLRDGKKVEGGDKDAVFIIEVSYMGWPGLGTLWWRDSC